jgi:hypothetical protein
LTASQYRGETVIANESWTRPSATRTFAPDQRRATKQVQISTTLHGSFMRVPQAVYSGEVRLPETLGLAYRSIDHRTDGIHDRSRDFPHRYPGTESLKMKPNVSAAEIAKRQFSAAVMEAEAAGLGHEGVCRSLLGLIVSKYLEDRPVLDVQSELRFVADNCDPETDFIFMRP